MADATSSRRPQGLPRGRRNTASQLVTRPRSFRACNRCRTYRIKCGAKPCLSCQVSNTQCIWRDRSASLGEADAPKSPAPFAQESPSDDLGLRPATSNGFAVISSISTGVGIEGGDSLDSAPHSAETDRSPPSGTCFTSSSTPNPSSPASLVHKFQLFIQRIEPALAPDGIPPNPFPVLPQDIANNGSSGLLEGAKLFNKDKQAYFVRLFWALWGPLFPFMDDEEFESLLMSDWASLAEQKAIQSALVDGMTALGLQISRAAGLGGRILGLCPDSVRQTSWMYFQSCRDRLRSETARATVNIIRCYILMILYELQANRIESAYYLVGLGVRRAHLSRLHMATPGHVPDQEAIRRVRAWRVLHWLDVHCSLQLDQPVAVSQLTSTCPPPLGTCHISGSTGCVSERTANGPLDSRDYFHFLYQSAFIVGKALAAVPPLDKVSTASAPELLAGQLSGAVDCLEELFTKLPEQLRLPREGACQKCGSVAPADTDTPAFSHTHMASSHKPGNSPVAMTLGVPDWLQRQRILLELCYLNARVLLQRRFIFQQETCCSSTEPEGSWRVDTRFGDDAVQHACCIISLLDDIYSKSDILDGLAMVAQFLWNATITIIVRMFLSPRSPVAGQLLDLASTALTILESLSYTNPDFQQICEITRSLTSQLRSQGVEDGDFDLLFPTLDLDLGALFSSPDRSHEPSGDAIEDAIAAILGAQGNGISNSGSGGLAAMLDVFEPSAS